MKKNKYMSLINVYSLIITTFLELILIVLLIVTFAVEGDKQFKLVFGSSIFGLLSFHHIIIKLLNVFFGRIGKNKIVIWEKQILFKNVTYDINTDLRIIYSKISLNNFLNACLAELVLFEKGKKILLGWFTGKEIKKMRIYLPIIKDEIRIKS